MDTLNTSGECLTHRIYAIVPGVLRPPIPTTPLWQVTRRDNHGPDPERCEGRGVRALVSSYHLKASLPLPAPHICRGAGVGRLTETPSGCGGRCGISPSWQGLLPRLSHPQVIPDRRHVGAPVGPHRSQIAHMVLREKIRDFLLAQFIYCCLPLFGKDSLSGFTLLGGSSRNFPDGPRSFRKHYILRWPKLYVPLLMLSIAVLGAQSPLAVPFTSNHLPRRESGFIRVRLRRLARGSPLLSMAQTATNMGPYGGCLFDLITCPNNVSIHVPRSLDATLLC